MGEELREASAVILVVASRYVRDMARQIASLIQPDAVVCIAAKGLEQGSAKTLSEVVAEELPEADICVLSGGSHAEEVATNLPSLPKLEPAFPNKTTCSRLNGSVL